MNGRACMYQVLGQSFGGFCLLTYLSMAPEAIEAGIFTGGLPPLGRTPEEVYQGTWWLVGGEGEIKSSLTLLGQRVEDDVKLFVRPASTLLP